MARKERTSERQRAHRLAWRLVDFIGRQYEWRIRFMDLSSVRARVSLGFGPDERFVGAMVADLNLIVIDPSYDDTLGVLIHECLHAMPPDASEERVLALETLVRKHLTPRQARAFVFLMHARLL